MFTRKWNTCFSIASLYYSIDVLKRLYSEIECPVNTLAHQNQVSWLGNLYKNPSFTMLNSWGDTSIVIVLVLVVVVLVVVMLKLSLFTDFSITATNTKLMLADGFNFHKVHLNFLPFSLSLSQVSVQSSSCDGLKGPDAADLFRGYIIQPLRLTWLLCLFFPSDFFFLLPLLHPQP